MAAKKAAKIWTSLSISKLEHESLWKQRVAKSKAKAAEKGEPFKEPKLSWVELRDPGCKCLVLCIMPSGHKSFIMRFRNTNGKMAKLTLGPFNENAGNDEPEIGDPLSLQAARRLAIATEAGRTAKKPPLPSARPLGRPRGPRLKPMPSDLCSSDIFSLMPSPTIEAGPIRQGSLG